jgi:thiol-disulfide isomerase/thioredoxin
MAQEAAAAPPAAAPAVEAPEVDPFAVPEGTDAATLQKFLTGLTQIAAEERTPAGLRSHFGKLLQAAETVSARQLDDDTALLAIRIQTGCLDILGRFGEPTATGRRQQLVEQLKQSDRPALATHGRILEVEGLVGGLQPGQTAPGREIVDRVAGLLEEQPLTDAHVTLAFGALVAVEGIGDPKLTAVAAERFAKALRAAGNDQYNSIAESFEGTARRLNLKGSPAEITGRTLDGKDFDIAALKGKVVLVDFWATWCGPCLEEMPALKALYDKHHAAGFEVVGVSLDDNRGRLEAFVTVQQIPWVTLFDENTGPQGENHRLANYYGVSSVPTTFLVGRDGKVVAIDLFGDDLAAEVERLLGTL